MGKTKESWSVSAVQCFENCPHMYQGKYLLKMRSPPGPAASRGLEIHAKAEQFLLGNIRGMPNELSKLKDEYRALKRTKPLVELKLAVDVKWNPVSWSQGWCRGVLDVMTRLKEEMIIIDHKTGRIYDKHVDQAQVYALLAYANTPDASNYHVEMWYTDQGKTKHWDYTPAKLKGVRKSWEERVDRVLHATKFPKTPSKQACKYCPRNSKRLKGDCHGWKKV